MYDLNIELDDRLPDDGISLYVRGDRTGTMEATIGCSSTVRAEVLSLLRDEFADAVIEAVESVKAQPDEEGGG